MYNALLIDKLINKIIKETERLKQLLQQFEQEER
jgi:hypothetical protein